MIASLFTTALAHPALIGASLWFADDDYSSYYGSGSDGDVTMLWLLGPAAGVGFFFWVFLRYRNTNKRHAYERHTATEMLDLGVYDQRTGRVTGTERSSIDGKNSSSPRQRLGSGSAVTTVDERPGATDAADSGEGSGPPPEIDSAPGAGPAAG